MLLNVAKRSLSEKLKIVVLIGSIPTTNYNMTLDSLNSVNIKRIILTIAGVVMVL